jgi:hypothetical protein
MSTQSASSTRRAPQRLRTRSPPQLRRLVWRAPMKCAIRTIEFGCQSHDADSDSSQVCGFCRPVHRHRNVHDGDAPEGIAVRFVGKGFVVWGCSKGFSVSSWSRRYNRSGFYVLPCFRGKDSCDVTASVSNQGRATVAIYKARW